MAKKNSPGCNCCCTILSDTFNRDDSTDLGANWTEVSGDWSINSSSLRISSTVRALAIATKQAPDPKLRLSVDIRASASNDRARLILDYIDADNYRYAEIRFGSSGSLSLGERVAGVETVIKTSSQPFSLNSFQTFTVCIHSDFDFFAASSPTISDPATPTTSGAFGLGTGGTMTGNLDFRNFTARHVSDECEECIVCPSCQAGPVPTFWDVTLPALVNDDCFDCANIGGNTYRLPFFDAGSFNDSCTWRLETTCDGDLLFVELRITDTSLPDRAFDVFVGGSLGQIRWRRVSTLQFDCGSSQVISRTAAADSPTAPCDETANEPVTCVPVF